MINLTKITYQNFKSVGNSPITISLDKYKTTLISGTNGTGKTTILDAICFALFGKGYGAANKPQLINSINQKHCLVTLEFEIGKKNFIVKRGMKPNVFEIYENGKLRKKSAELKDDQKVLEQQILKMNYRSFTQVVIMGSGYYVPFMRLPLAQRREFIEDLLDIRIFSVMNRLLFDKNKALKEELKEVDFKLKSTKEKIKMQQEFIDKIKKERSDDVERNNREIAKLEKENLAHETKLNNHRTALGKLEKRLTKYESINEELDEVRISYKRLEKTIKEYNTKREFYSDTTICPTCNQDIHDGHRDELVKGVESDIVKQESEMQKLQKTLDNLLKEVSKKDEIIDKISEENSMIDRVNSLISINNSLITKSNKNIEQQQTNTTVIDGEKEKLKKFAKEAVECDNKKRKLLETQQYYELSALMLQDNGIKARIIKQYIPTINKMINKYLSALDFFVSFNLDENFNETVKSRHRDEFTYESFSEGQKLRIDLALTFAWREIAKLKNSVNTNLLIFDEILDGSLDSTGVDLFMTLLEKINIENIFIISHRDIGDKFEDNIKFELKNNFTVMKEN